MLKPFAILLLPISSLLMGCEQLGIETPGQVNIRQEAEGKAIGGACRHAGRALEDCYKSSPKTSKAAIYSGWRDMDIYMRENKLEVVITTEERNAQRAATEPPPPAETGEAPAEAPAEAPTEKPAGKGKKQS